MTQKVRPAYEVLRVFLFIAIVVGASRWPQCRELEQLAESIGSKWQAVAHSLDPERFTSDEIQHIQRVCSGDHGLVMLEIWYDSHLMDATVEKLCNALKEAGLKEYAEDVFPEHMGLKKNGKTEALSETNQSYCMEFFLAALKLPYPLRLVDLISTG